MKKYDYLRSLINKNMKI